MTHQSNHSHTQQDEADHAPHPQSFWRSRAGIYLIVALVISGLLLGYEHRVHLLSSGLLIWLPLFLCVGMHFFMHGGHGGHGKKDDE